SRACATRSRPSPPSWGSSTISSSARRPTPSGASARAPSAPPARAFARSLYDNIQRLRLDVERIAPFHGNRLVTMEDLTRDAGVQPAGE
ncbi:MAG: hypothetical protein AB7P99_15680, partial [Vicinamibacterales bacterium]